MPTVFRQDGFCFFFYSNEGNPREPVHIHVMRAGAEAKLWLATEVSVAQSEASTPVRCAASPTSWRRAGPRSKGHGMTISPEAVRFDEDAMWVTLSDGRTLGVPLAWFPRLLHAGPEDRAAVILSPFGLHWESLDEDISVAGLLAGRGDQGGVGRVA
jgi:hypothetical protein